MSAELQGSGGAGQHWGQQLSPPVSPAERSLDPDGHQSNTWTRMLETSSRILRAGSLVCSSFKWGWTLKLVILNKLRCSYTHVLPVFMGRSVKQTLEKWISSFLIWSGISLRCVCLLWGKRWRSWWAAPATAAWLHSTATRCCHQLPLPNARLHTPRRKTNPAGGHLLTSSFYSFLSLFLGWFCPQASSAPLRCTAPRPPSVSLLQAAVITQGWSQWLSLQESNRYEAG